MAYSCRDAAAIWEWWVYTNVIKPVIIAKAKVIFDFMQYISQYLSLFCECRIYKWFHHSAICYFLTSCECLFTIRYDTIEEINVDSKAEYTA